MKWGLVFIVLILLVALIMGVIYDPKKPEPLVENAPEAQAGRDSLQAQRDSARGESDSLKKVVDSILENRDQQVARLQAQIAATNARAAQADSTTEDAFWEPLYFAAADERDRAMVIVRRDSTIIDHYREIRRLDSVNIHNADLYYLRAEYRIDSLQNRLRVVTTTPKLLGLLPLPEVQATYGYSPTSGRMAAVVGVGYRIPLASLLRKNHNREK